jgi:hypothetical protein
MGGQLSASQRLNGAYTLRLALNVHQDAHRTKAKYLAVEVENLFLDVENSVRTWKLIGHVVKQ